MATSKKAYKYSVELNIHAVDAPGARMKTSGELYVNICLLGVHRRTRHVPPSFPMHLDQSLYFEKLFKSCHDPRDILQRLEREHVLIELIQANVPSPVVLATYETSAKDFLYPHSTSRVQYVGLRRPVLLSRTIDFPGVTPSLTFTASPSVDDVSGIASVKKTRKAKKPVASYGKMPERSKSPSRRPSPSYVNGSSTSAATNVSRSLTSHTISSAVKNDYAQRQTREKLRELAIAGEVKHVVPIDKTGGRDPFVVRRVDDSLINRKPDSHTVLNDGLVVNDYSMSRPGSSISIYSSNHGVDRSRSVSPAQRRRLGSAGRRSRSTSASRRAVKTSQSTDFEHRNRSQSPGDRFNLRSTRRLYNQHDYHDVDDEFHSIELCDICRMHRLHSEQSRKAKSFEQQQFVTASERKSYAPDIDYTGRSYHLTSPTLVRDPFRYRHRQSPAFDLSDKVIHTLRRNLDSYSQAPRPRYYSAFRYSDGHADDDELLERSRLLTQA